MRCLFALAVLASCLFAHHSTAIYDLVHGTIIVGEVTRFEWENPHAHIYLDVDGENGEVEHWLVEMESPALLGRFGWKKDTLKAGDQITVTGGRAKDGSFRIRAAHIILPDGRKLPALPPVDN
jgi:Family of unknown function (DUF6152)